MQWHERLKRPLAGSQLDVFLANAARYGAELFALAVDGRGVSAEVVARGFPGLDSVARSSNPCLLRPIAHEGHDIGVCWDSTI